MEQNTDGGFDLDAIALNLDNDLDVVELLAGDLHCPLCGCPYDPADTRLIRERAGAVTLSVQCHCCGTGSLIMVEREPRTPIAATELTPVERAFFAYLPPISEADVQRVRILLEAHQGNLRDLI